MKYFLTNTNNTAPATLTDARAICHAVKHNVVDVIHIGEGYGIETDVDDPRLYFPVEAGIIPVECVHVEGTYPRNWANILIRDVKRWGGRVNYAAEAFENTYLDLDIIKRADNGLVLYMAKSMAL